MKHLIPSTNSQTIKIIPRVYSTNIVMSIRDDSTNDFTLMFPDTIVINRNFLEITDVFNLKEGLFYDLKIYYGNFERRIDNDKGILESIQCLNAKYGNLDVIYRDKIFCTIQSTNQASNEYYTVNKDVYKEKSGNNDFIIL